MLYFYRCISVIPSLFFVLFIEKFIIHNWLSKFIHAPFFYPSQMEKICSNLWMPLTFVQNYLYSLTEGPVCILLKILRMFIIILLIIYKLNRFQCIPPFYYLAVDFQLFMLTPLVIYVIFKWKKLDKIIFSALIVASIAINYSYVNSNLNYFRSFEL